MCCLLYIHKLLYPSAIAFILIVNQSIEPETRSFPVNSYLYTVDLGYNVMKGTGYFMSL
jgi:hypothetical protein